MYKENTLLSNQSIRTCLEKLEILKVKCIVILSDNNIVKGVVTDGDIRRAFISGCDLEDPILDIVNKDFFSLKEKKGMNFFPDKKGMLVPVIDKKGFLNDIVRVSSLGFITFIDAVIMAGGKGTRLTPLTLDTPKPLINLNDKKRIIDLPLDLLQSYGFQKVIIIANYKSKKVINFFKNTDRKMIFEVLVENSFLGTFGAVAYFKEKINTDFVLINSDVYIDLDLYKMWELFRDTNANICVASMEQSNYIDFGVFEQKNGNVLKVVEKPTYVYNINLGIYIVDKNILSNDFVLDKDGLYHITYEIERLIEEGKVKSFVHRGFWHDIGRIEDLNKVKKILLINK